MMNQRLVDENHRLKKDFQKTHHRLKTLLADKKDLLRRLRLESKATNKLIQSIQDEAQDTMERARDILSKANRSKNDAIERANDILSEANQSKYDTELLKDEIDKSRNELLGVRMNLRKQSARLKRQAARMTETQNRRKRALAEQRK
jgi:ParB-like chromosome segregation protein Spo0J